MPMWVFVTVTIGNIVSLIAWGLIHRETRDALRSHTRVVTERNKSLVRTRTLATFRILYAMCIVGFTAASYYLFLNY